MKVNLTGIKKYLVSCAFNPRKPGPFAVIIESGGPEYWENRAVELIKESQGYGFHEYNKQVSTAIRLLALARETRFVTQQNLELSRSEVLREHKE